MKFKAGDRVISRAEWSHTKNKVGTVVFYKGDSNSLPCNVVFDFDRAGYPWCMGDDELELADQQKP